MIAAALWNALDFKNWELLPVFLCLFRSFSDESVSILRLRAFSPSSPKSSDLETSHFLLEQRLAFLPGNANLDARNGRPQIHKGRATKAARSSYLASCKAIVSRCKHQRCLNDFWKTKIVTVTLHKTVFSSKPWVSLQPQTDCCRSCKCRPPELESCPMSDNLRRVKT